MPHISISHRDGEGYPTGRAGIDMESVEQRLPFAETWFRPTERAHCQGDARRESQVWAVKEAVLKVLGTGLPRPPRGGSAEHRRQPSPRAIVGAAQARHAALGGEKSALIGRRTNNGHRRCLMAS